jgi:uncharacterized membrane protein YccC
VLDSLAAIATAVQRARSEPRQVRPPLDLLERVQLRSYRLLAQLGGVRTWREQPSTVPQADSGPLLAGGLAQIGVALEGGDAPPAEPAPVEVVTETISATEARAVLRQRLVDAVAEARALGSDLAAAYAWESARLAGKEH